MQNAYDGLEIFVHRRCAGQLFGVDRKVANSVSPVCNAGYHTNNLLSVKVITLSDYFEAT